VNEPFYPYESTDIDACVCVFSRIREMSNIRMLAKVMYKDRKVLQLLDLVDGQRAVGLGSIELLATNEFVLVLAPVALDSLPRLAAHHHCSAIRRHAFVSKSVARCVDCLPD